MASRALQSRRLKHDDDPTADRNVHAADGAPTGANAAAAAGGVRPAALVRAGDRAHETIAFEEAMVRFFVDAAELLGIPKSIAAIYGICFATPEPLGFSEIQERLDISAGSISQGLRVLRQVGALRVAEPTLSFPLKTPAMTPGSRARERFEPDLELRRMISHFIKQRVDYQLASGRGTLRTLARQVPAKTPGGKVLQQRLKSLEEWHDKARALLPLVKTFLRLA